MPKYITIVAGKAFSYQDDEMAPLEDGVYEVIEKRQDVRTVQQNRAVHLYCKQVAEALNDNGHSVVAVLKPDIQFSMITVKEQMFKPILTALRGKNSTTQMTTKEVDEVYHIMNKVLGEKWGIHIPFPDKETR